LMPAGPVARWCAGFGGVLACWAVASALLPNGLPFGIILFGLILGSLSSLTALGLIIVYRSARIINFAQAEIGGLSATVAVVMVAGLHLPYFVALPTGLAAALATGALIDLTVIRKLFKAPRLILTVATIGLAQVIGAAELFVPHLFTHLQPLATFSTPFRFTFTQGPIIFNGDYVAAMIVVPLMLILLAWFFGRTGLGIAVRGAADSNDRALLLGIPVRRLSTITWIVAAGLSGVGAMLSGPILGPQLGILAGPQALLAPLAAAVLARMESLTTAFLASLAIGVFEQAVFWSYPRSTTVDVGLFLVVLFGLLIQRRRISRADDPGLGSYVALREVRPIPTAMRKLPEVRLARLAGWVLLALVVVVVPLGLSDAKRTVLAYVAIYGMLAVSLVVLTGWSGQISLGQFAFAGVGAGTTASLFVHLHADLFLSLAAAALVGAGAAIIIGIPALRLSGLFLAVTTLAFAVPVSDFLLNSTYFPSFAPSVLERPAVMGRFDLNSAATFYYFCLLFLVVAVALARNYRRSRAGRVVLAVRDNARGAASYSVSPVRARLTAFAVSGAVAGVAGGLYAVGLRGIPFSGYNPENSVQVFTMVVVGGLGSLAGGLIGAAYVQGVQYFLHGPAQLLATGGGILLVVLVLPAGLADLCYRARDVALRAVARGRGLSVPSLAERAAFAVPDDVAGGGSNGSAVTEGGTDPFEGADVRLAPSLVELRGVDAAYGQVQVLFDVGLSVYDGEVVGLLGTNGAGKSTLLRVISGLLPARRGTVIFGGVDITTLDPVARVKAGLVMVPSGRGVFPSLTVAENLRLGAWLARNDPAFVEATTDRILELFPALRMRLLTAAANLSGGEQQMLTISQALYCRPKVLMIDELSLGLAPTIVSELLGVVRSLAASGVTVVIVEQSLNVATSIAERAVFMERGQVRFTGPTAELSQRPDLVRSVFLGAVSPARRGRARSNMAGRVVAGAAARATRPEAPGADRATLVFQVADVECRFGGVAALDGVSLGIAKGEILGIIGANGAGKTTLFDVCSGFLAPSSGHVLLEGVDVTGLAAHERADLGMGRVFQDARLFPSLTVAETIAVALERHIEVRDPFISMLRTGPVIDSEAEVSERVDELIERLGLERYRDAFISELSTGTRRVVELACVLGHDPKVLLLDEPTSGIAQRESEAFGRLILDLRDQTGGTFVVVEHDVPLVSSISDRLLCLHVGVVIAEGTPAQVVANPAVIAAYLGADASAIARSGATAAPRRRPRPPKAPPGATVVPPTRARAKTKTKG